MQIFCSSFWCCWLKRGTFIFRFVLPVLLWRNSLYYFDMAITNVKLMRIQSNFLLIVCVCFVWWERRKLYLFTWWIIDIPASGCEGVSGQWKSKRISQIYSFNWNLGKIFRSGKCEVKILGKFGWLIKFGWFFSIFTG